MDDLDSSMILTRAIAGPMTALITSMISMTLFAPAVLYVIARWRAQRDPAADPQLGLKFALHYFAMLAFQLALVSGTVLLWALLSGMASSSKGPYYRGAFGLLVPALIVLGAHRFLLKKTNDHERLGVRRLFLGYNLIIIGLFGFVGLIVAFEALFAKGGSGELGRIAGAMVLTYGTAWALLGARFGQLVAGGGASPPIDPS